jgi:hypothetical protein
MADTWYERKPAPAPRSDFSAVNVSQQQPLQTRYSTGGNMSSGGRSYSQFAQPRPDYLQQAIDIYSSNQTQRPRDNSREVYVTDYQDNYNERIANRYVPQGSGGRSSTYTRGGQPAFQREIQNLQAIEVPEAPEFKAREYKPPEEDESIYGKARQEAISPGLRSLRQGTREAISSAQSLDNPTARGQFIKQALQGMGAGLENVASQASREARTVARDKRAEQLSIYNTKYQARSAADKINYQAKVNQMAQDFAQQQMIAQANYQQQFNLDPRLKMPGDSNTGTGSNLVKGFGSYRGRTGNFYML